MIIRASSLERRFLCPGSLKAEEGMPDIPSKAADSGNKIHNALRIYFSGTAGNLDDIATVCKLDNRESIVLRWFANNADTEIENHGGADKRWPELHLPDTGDGIEGTSDLVVHCNDNTWHVFDWKTGYGKQITATMNLQLRAYCVLVAEKFGLFHVKGHLYSAGDDPADSAFTSVTYGPDEIEESRKEIYAIRDACIAENAPRIPSLTGCKWCRACGNPTKCNESCQIQEDNLPDIIEQPLTPELVARLKPLYLAFKQAESAQKRFESWLKNILATQPGTIPWAKLAKPSQQREVTDAEKAFIVGCTEGWFTQPEFVRKCITVKVPAIEKLAKRYKKHKEVTDKLMDAGALEIKSKQPAIELMKE